MPITTRDTLLGSACCERIGVDFFENYSPVASMNSIRVVLDVYVAKRYIIAQLDADMAFLNSDIKEGAYMQVPNGIDNVEK